MRKLQYDCTNMFFAYQQHQVDHPQVYLYITMNQKNLTISGAHQSVGHEEEKSLYLNTDLEKI